MSGAVKSRAGYERATGLDGSVQEFLSTWDCEGIDFSLWLFSFQPYIFIFLTNSGFGLRNLELQMRLISLINI